MLKNDITKFKVVTELSEYKIIYRKTQKKSANKTCCSTYRLYDGYIKFRLYNSSPA